MRNTYFYLLAFLFVSLGFIACSDDDKNELPGTDLTKEEIKELLEKEANAFIADMHDLSKEEGLKVLSHFSSLFTKDDEYSYQPYTGVSRAVKKLTVADFYCLYTWTEDEWIITENDGKKAEFLFPSSNKSNSNDAKIVATGESSNVSIVEDGEEIVLPKQVDAVVSVGSKTVAEIDMKVDWVSADKLPNSAKMSLDLVQYGLTMQVDKGSKNSATAVLKKGSKTLIDIDATIDTDLDKALNGTFDKGNANATIKLTDDLAFVGTMDVKKYIDAENKLDKELEDNANSGNYAQAWNTYNEGVVKAFNENTNFVLNSRKDGKNGTRLAVLKARVKEYKDSDYNDRVYELQFDDETAVDADVYFGEGFNTVINNWNKFISSFN